MVEARMCTCGGGEDENTSVGGCKAEHAVEVRIRIRVHVVEMRMRGQFLEVVEMSMREHVVE